MTLKSGLIQFIVSLIIELLDWVVVNDVFEDRSEDSKGHAALRARLVARVRGLSLQNNPDNIRS